MSEKDGDHHQQLQREADLRADHRPGEEPDHERTAQGGRRPAQHARSCPEPEDQPHHHQEGVQRPRGGGVHRDGRRQGKLRGRPGSGTAARGQPEAGGGQHPQGCGGRQARRHLEG